MKSLYLQSYRLFKVSILQYYYEDVVFFQVLGCHGNKSIVVISSIAAAAIGEQ